MATPADQRLLELLEKWLKSLELHIRYSSLDSDSYASIQPWPEHQRPSRWIIDLAVQKTVALRSQVQERIKMGDTKFSDSLELMTFLTNLVGSEHIERFIPFAEPQNERELRPATPAASAAPTVSAVLAAPTVPTVSPMPAVVPAAPAVVPAAQPQSAPDATTGTREMPAFVAARGRVPSTDRGAAGQSPSASDATTGTREMPEFVGIKRQAPPPVGTAHVARAERKPASARPVPRTASKHPGKLTVPSKHATAEKPAAHDNAAAPRDAAPLDSSPSDAAREQVIADAARLVQWGRKWYELAELIARMAGRPVLSEVRRIIKDNKTAIEKKAGRS